MKNLLCRFAAIPRLRSAHLLLIVLLSSTMQSPSRAAGVVSNPAYNDLTTALQDGGTVTFNCDGTIHIWQTLNIETDTILDGAGHRIILDGRNQTRLFRVAEGVSFTVNNVTLTNGLSVASTDYDYENGGFYPINAAGGAILNYGTVGVTNCILSNNRALSIAGVENLNWWEYTPWIMTHATGGAVANYGTAHISNCTLTNNQAIGAAGVGGQDGAHGRNSDPYTGMGGTDGEPGTAAQDGSSGHGGAIHSQGELEVTNCTFFENSAVGGDGGAGGRGGSGGWGGYSRFRQAGFGGAPGSNGGHGGSGMGGAIYGSDVKIKNCTFAQNYTVAGNGGNGGDGGNGGMGYSGGDGSDGGGAGYGGNGGVAGGLAGVAGARGEAGPASGGGSLGRTGYEGSPGLVGNPGYNHVESSRSSVRTVNTIFGPGPAANCQGIIDGGNNLSTDASCNFGSTGFNNTDPQLGPLADNGGPTQTMALPATSPAVGRGNDSLALGTDQRGLPRIGRSDIGAFEVQGSYHAISGRVANNAGIGVANVRITLSPTPPGVVGSLLTNSAGYFTFRGVATGNYSLTPELATYKFTPVVRNVNVVSADLVAQNFTGNPVFNITGRIANSAGTGIANIAVMRSGSGTPAVTDANGNYQFADVVRTTYTITASKTYFSFVPASRSVSPTAPIANFTALFTISGLVRTAGSVGIEGVSVGLSPAGASAPATTNARGEYVIRNVPSGLYYVNPVKSGYTIVPNSQGLGVTTAPRAANFVGKQVFRIIGRISNSSGVGIPNVSVLRSGSATPVLTNGAGYYILEGVPAGTYTVSPSRNGYSFAPANKTVVIGTADVQGQNFIGGGG